MDRPYLPQPIDAHTDHVDGLSRPGEYPYLDPYSWSPRPDILLPRLGALPSNISSGSYYTVPDLQPSNVPSSQSNTYYSAVSSPSYATTTNTGSTLSSNISFPYSVTSINSRKSRKNVLYPRRAHPLPLPELEPEPSESFPMSHDILSLSTSTRIWMLCTALLPRTETLLVPAGKVLLKSLGFRNGLQLVPVRTDDDARYCSDLFITLTHEVHLKHAVSARELKDPCKLLHTTIKEILSKSGAFSSPKNLKWPNHKVLTLQRVSQVLLALLSVLHIFETALNSIKIKPASPNHRSYGDNLRAALLGISTPTGLTMEKCRTKLDRNLAQNRVELTFWLGPARHSPPTTVVLPRDGVRQSISTIEEVLESEGEDLGEESSVNGHTLSYSDDGKNSLPRRIFRRLIPSSIRRRDA